MLPKIQLGESQHKNTLVIPFLQEDKEKDASFYFPGKKNKDIDQLESKLKEAKHFHGKKNEVNFLRFYSFQGYENVLCLGLGKESKINPEIIRQAGAAIYQAQAKEHIKQVHVLGDGLLSKIKSSDQVYTVQAFSEGYFLASYHYPKSEPKKDSFKVEGLSLPNAS
jgi:leucyl aminopeptidase